MVDLERYSAQFRDLPQGVKEAEVNGVLEEELSLEVRDGQIADSKTFRRTRLYVRASADKTGIVCTEKLDEDPREVILRAVNNSRFSNAEEPEPMNEVHSRSVLWALRAPLALLNSSRLDLAGKGTLSPKRPERRQMFGAEVGLCYPYGQLKDWTRMRTTASTRYSLAVSQERRKTC